ncbi:hypothetical protein MRX96_004911 [Rhipicephalus microplus]
MRAACIGRAVPKRRERGRRRNMGQGAPPAFLLSTTNHRERRQLCQRRAVISPFLGRNNRSRDLDANRCACCRRWACRWVVGRPRNKTIPDRDNGDRKGQTVPVRRRGVPWLYLYAGRRRSSRATVVGPAPRSWKSRYVACFYSSRQPFDYVDPRVPPPWVSMKRQSGARADAEDEKEGTLLSYQRRRETEQICTRKLGQPADGSMRSADRMVELVPAE